MAGNKNSGRKEKLGYTTRLNLRINPDLAPNYVLDFIKELENEPDTSERFAKLVKALQSSLAPVETPKKNNKAKVLAMMNKARKT